MEREKPKIIKGGISIDDRGQVMFVNDFNFEGVKRFYIISNHRAGFVRAWHGHKEEAKYALAVSGAALVGVVAIDNWEEPAQDAEVRRYVLSEKLPQLLYIPPGYANGSMLLTDDAQLIFFSTTTLEESLKDTIQYDARYWDIWQVKER